jgi:stalled ribosome rescue protein Dom34
MTQSQKNHRPLHQIAVWVDHREAILAFFENVHLLREEELFSEAGSHTHGGGWSQKRIEAHRHAVLDHFYEEIIQELSGADQVILYGPGQAKHELEHHINRNKVLSVHLIAVTTTDKMSEHALALQALADFSLANPQ